MTEKVESLEQASLNEFVTVDEFKAARKASYAVRLGTLSISRLFESAERAEILAAEVRHQLAERERQVWAEAAKIADKCPFSSTTMATILKLVSEFEFRARGEQVK